jgi:hypothetical protein
LEHFICRAARFPIPFQRLKPFGENSLCALIQFGLFAGARWLCRHNLFLPSIFTHFNSNLSTPHFLSLREPESPTCFDPTLSLYLRYQSTHERSFHKAHALLTKIKAERKKTEQAAAREESTRQLGFVLQKRALLR